MICNACLFLNQSLSVTKNLVGHIEGSSIHSSYIRHWTKLVEIFVQVTFLLVHRFFLDQTTGTYLLLYVYVGCRMGRRGNW